MMDVCIWYESHWYLASLVFLSWKWYRYITYILTFIIIVNCDGSGKNALQSKSDLWTKKERICLQITIKCGQKYKQECECVERKLVKCCCCRSQSLTRILCPLRVRALGHGTRDKWPTGVRGLSLVISPEYWPLIGQLLWTLASDWLMVITVT